MKDTLIYIGSSIASTLAFVLILGLFGILGAGAYAASLIAIKIAAFALLWFLMVRIPIAVIKSRRVSAIKKIREANEAEAMKMIQAAAATANQDRVNFKVPKADHPITPMPADPEEE
jgi:hypothetical protein